ncbi:MAG: DVUA0089 family protein [Planctomycetota bacterium]
MGSTTLQAQTAYFSWEGEFATTSDQHNFLFDLSRSVSSSEALRFETFANSGGTNAAGATIDPGGIDSVVELFDSNNASRGVNDDYHVAAEGRDSLLSWSNVPLPGPVGRQVFLNPDPLTQGGYRLNLSAFPAVGPVPWALDLVGPADAMALTGAQPTGSSTITALQFGTTGPGTTPARYTQAGGSLELFGLVAAETGRASMTISGGGQVSNAIGAIGFQSGSVGTVVVTGTDANGNASTWSNATDLSVGVMGDGTLNVLSGGRVTNGRAGIAAQTGSTGVVTVTGIDGNGNASNWTSSGDLVVAARGTGTLNVTDGGRVSSEGQ